MHVKTPDDEYPIGTREGSGFYDKNRNFYMTRCYACGLENYAAAVSSGTCAWCGWKHPEGKDK